MSTPHAGFTGPAALVPGELRGYRRFRLGEDGLYPTVHAAGGPWSGSLERARCAVEGDHAAPDWDCGCGLYGWYDPGDAAQVSGFGDTSGVIAAQGRSILGDSGFRASSARIEAVALPVRVRLRPSAAAGTRRMLAAAYPEVRVYRSPRAMLRDHPPQDLRALGIDARPTRRRRYKLTAFGLWAAGVAGCYSLAFLPRGAADAVGPGLWVGVLGAFLVWQVLLIWLVTRWCAPPEGRSSR